MSEKIDRRIRHGKTARDRKNGYFSRKMSNRDVRNSYCNDQKAVNTAFPFYACNGHKNKYRITGKDGQTVFLKRQK